MVKNARFFGQTLKISYSRHHPQEILGVSQTLGEVSYYPAAVASSRKKKCRKNVSNFGMALCGKDAHRCTDEFGTGLIENGGRADGRAGGRTDERTDGRGDGRTGGRAGGRTDGPI